MVSFLYAGATVTCLTSGTEHVVNIKDKWAATIYETKALLVPDTNDAEEQLHIAAVNKTYEVCVFLSKHGEISINTVIPSVAPALNDLKHEPDRSKVKTKNKLSLKKNRLAAESTLFNDPEPASSNPEKQQQPRLRKTNRPLGPLRASRPPAPPTPNQGPLAAPHPASASQEINPTSTGTGSTIHPPSYPRP